MGKNAYYLTAASMCILLLIIDRPVAEMHETTMFVCADFFTQIHMKRPHPVSTPESLPNKWFDFEIEAGLGSANLSLTNFSLTSTIRQ